MQGQLRLTGGRKLLSPRGSDTRPTTSRVREAVMNILSSRLLGSRWLDLCSGSGVMGCEALQRGAEMVLAVERNSATAQICERNLEATRRGSDNDASIMVIRSEVLGWLSRGWDDDPFDLVYIDPPYGNGLYRPILDRLLSGPWLRAESLVICEHAADDTPEAGDGWIEADRRRYGSTGLLILSPPERCHLDGTDSKPPQTGQSA